MALEEQVKHFVAQLPKLKGTEDQSFEVRWSLSELEDIVYDFIHAN